MKSGLRTTLVFLAPAGVLFPLWSARLGVSPPLWSALSSLRSDLSECFLPLASPCPSPSPATARLGCLAARPRSKVKAPSSQISRRGAEGEACLEVPAEEMRMSCLAFPPCSHDRELLRVRSTAHIGLTQYCLYIRKSSQRTSRTMNTARMTEAISQSEEAEEDLTSSCCR